MLRAIVIIFTILAMLPAYADGSAADADNATKSDSPAPKNHGNVACRLASFAAGMTLGTPVAVARQCWRQTVSDTRELAGNFKTPLVMIPAATLSVPFGLFSGTWCGLYSSARNSWSYSDDKPFCKEAFSLGEMK